MQKINGAGFNFRKDGRVILQNTLHSLVPRFLASLANSTCRLQKLFSKSRYGWWYFKHKPTKLVSNFTATTAPHEITMSTYEEIGLTERVQV